MGSTQLVLLWLGTYAVHSSLVLGAVWLLERWPFSLSTVRRVSLWRFALVTAFFTASLQAGGLIESQSGRWAVFADTASVSPAAPAPVRGNALPAVAGEAASSPANSDPVATARSDAVSTAAASANPPRSIADPIAVGSIDWALWLLLALLLVGFVRLIRLAFRARSACRLLADRRPLDAGPLYARLTALAARAGATPPRLSVSQHLSGPITLPSGEICLPADVHDSLAPDLLDALLAHELAHSIRRDALWLNAALLIEAVLFWQPLHRVARRRLTRLSEIAADDWAVRRTGRPRALVECLVEFAERTQTGPLREFSAAMARDDAALLERSRRLLERDGSNDPEPGLSPAAKWFFLSALVVLALVLPQLVGTRKISGDATAASNASASTPAGPPAAAGSNATPGFSELPAGVYDPDPAAFGVGNSGSYLAGGSGLTVISGGNGSTSVSINGRNIRVGSGGDSGIFVGGGSIKVNGGTISINSNNGGSNVINVASAASGDSQMVLRSGRFALISSGDIALRPDGSGVESIAPGGVIDIAEFEGRDRQRFRLEGGDDIIARAWWVDGERRPWDADADAAFANILPVVMRESTLGARRAVASLLANGGSQAVLDEIGRLDNDMAQAGYARQFVELAGSDLSDDDFARLLRIVGNGLSQDPQLSNLLEDFASRVGASDELVRAWLAAAAKISSDVHRANAMEALGLEARLTPAGWIALLEAAESIGSDVHHANLLAELAERLPRNDAMQAAYLHSVNTIGSSVHRGRALDAYF